MKKQDDVDIVELLRSVWDRRRFILKVTSVITLVGVALALLGEVKYTAWCVMVPQTGRENQTGNLQGLAAMAGINLAAADQSAGLSPKLYPMVAGSVPFQKQLLHSPVTLEGHDGPVTLLDYLSERRYQKFSLFPFIMRYTVGLPGVIRQALHRDEPAVGAPSGPGNDGVPIEALTFRENEGMRALSHLLSVKVDEQNGYISLAVVMPRARVAAQVTARAQELLQDFIVHFKVQKVQADLEFIEERYAEVRADFEARQRALATFQDSHRNITSALARTEESRLEGEYNLAYSIYSEIASQREQAEIKVKEDTPVFTVIEPVTVPIQKSAPKRMMTLALSIILGLLAGIGLVLVLPFFSRVFDFGWLKGWSDPQYYERIPLSKTK